MKSALVLFVSALIVASCAAPEAPERFVDTRKVSSVIQKDSKGMEAEIYFPKDGEITLYPTEDKITFIDETGKPRTVRPSYSVIYEEE